MTSGLGSINHNVPDGPDWLVREVAELRNMIEAERSARSLEAARIGAGGIILDGGVIRTSNFDGDAGVPSVGTAGVAFGGPHDTLIVGDILLRGGIIGDDALTNPVQAAIANGASGGYSFTAAATAYETVNVAVPAGFSQALVMAVATAGMTAITTGSTPLIGQARINGVTGQSIEATCATNSGMSVHAPFALLVTGLSGGTFPISSLAWVTAPANVTAGSCNAQVSATILFLR
jgi:hypothetical protein